MSAAESIPERSNDRVPRAAQTPAWAPWLRPAILVIAGLIATFTAALHHLLDFDRTMVGLSLAALGVAHLVEWRSANARSPIPLLLGAVALIAAVLQLFAATPTVFALILAAWALVSGLCELLGAMLGFSSRVDSVFLGALGVVLATLILLVLADPIASVGFFGAYAMMAGVYTAISAIDVSAKRARAATADAIRPMNRPSSNESAP